MNPSLDKALYFLTNNGNFDDVSVDDLERLTKEHPYFSIGHLLLAKKMKIKDDQRFAQHIQKTALYFSNPYWLHYQLLNYPPGELDVYTEDKANDNSAAVSLIQLPAEDVIAIETDTLTDVVVNQEHEIKETTFPVNVTEDEATYEALMPEPITTKFTVDELEHASELAHHSLADTTPGEIDTDANQPVPITTVFSTAEIEHASQLAHESLSDTHLQEPIDKDESERHDQLVTVNEETVHDETEKLDKIKSAFDPFVGAKSELSNVEIDAIKDQPPTSPVPVEEPQQQTSNTQHLVVTEEHATQAEEEMAVTGREPEPSAEAFINEENEDLTLNEVIEKGVIPVEKKAEPDEHEVMFQNIKAMLDASAEEAGKETEGGFIPLDPYHTIDYFASQGIKLELDPNPQDKLGKQLKKFTHWLKHMKKLGPEDALESVEDAQAEADVQEIADTSNTAREIVTEAMATVLEKQGKKEKAVQLYIKLSFLNPDKSAYFADKIKKLKGI